MKLTFKVLLAVALGASLVGCKGGGSSNGGSSKALSQQELAELFVKNFNEMLSYSEDYRPDNLIVDELTTPEDIVLLKSTTEQGGKWVVIEDTFGGYLIAVNLEGFNGQTWGKLYEYMAHDETGQFIGFGYNNSLPLADNGDGTYTDLITGLLFERSQSSYYDEELVAAVNDVKAVQKNANGLVSEFGFPVDKALEISKLSQRMSAVDKRSLSAKDYQNFTTEVLGSVDAAERYQNAITKVIETGNSDDLDEEIRKTSEYHNLSEGQVRLVIEKLVFGSN